MTKHLASAHDNEKPQRPSRSSRKGKVVLIKKGTKKPTRPKAAKNLTMAIPEPLMMNSPSTNGTNGNVEARIAERAYELHHHRGGHHGQDLDDWLTAEREVLSEESCS